MGKYEISSTRFLIYIMPIITFIIVGALFSSGNFFWGLFFLLSYILGCEVNRHIRQVYSELSWVRKCAESTYYFKFYLSGERHLSDWAAEQIMEGNIKKGMTKAEIGILLDSYCEKHLVEHPSSSKSNILKSAFQQYFIDGKGVDEAIRLHAWGTRMPTPIIMLKFHRNILMWWSFETLYKKGIYKNDF